MIQKPPSVNATTAASENAYSPDDPDSSSSGRNAAMVVTEEIRSGSAYHSPRASSRLPEAPRASRVQSGDVLDDHHTVVDQQAERDDDGGD